jgi:hypothetical protein
MALMYFNSNFSLNKTFHVWIKDAKAHSICNLQLVCSCELFTLFHAHPLRHKLSRINFLLTITIPGWAESACILSVQANLKALSFPWGSAAAINVASTRGRHPAKSLTTCAPREAPVSWLRERPRMHLETHLVMRRGLNAFENKIIRGSPLCCFSNLAESRNPSKFLQLTLCECECTPCSHHHTDAGDFY